MTETVFLYKVWCVTEAQYFEIWGTTASTLCPNGHALDPNLTSIVKKVAPSTTSIDNQQKTVYDEINTSELDVIIRLNFNYNISALLTLTAVTGSGSIGHSNKMAVLSTGAAASSSASLYSNRPVPCRSDQSYVTRFTGVFTPGVVGNTQLIGAFDNDNGVGFGFNGADFGVFYRTGGTTTWVLQTDWNIDKLDGTGPSGNNINFGDGNGNTFQIKFQEFGGIIFSISSPSSLSYSVVHKVQYANNFSIPMFDIGIFPVKMEVENTSNSTDISIKSSSLMLGVEGKYLLSGPTFSTVWQDIPVGNGSETMIKAFKTASTFNGKTSKINIFPLTFSIISGLNDKPQVYRLRANATFTSPVWTDIFPTQSVTQQLTSGTWNGDGVILSRLIVPGSGKLFFREYATDTNNKFIITPGTNVIITLEGIGGAATTSGTVTWLEEQ